MKGVDSVGVEYCDFPLTKPVAVNTVLALPRSRDNAVVCGSCKYLLMGGLIQKPLNGWSVVLLMCVTSCK